MENYEFIKDLGRGTFGTVIQAYDKRHRRNVAIKMYNKGEDIALSAIKEIEILRVLLAKGTESNVVNYYGSFRFEHQWCVVLELLGINLLELIIRENYSFKLEELQVISRSVLTGLQHLHESKIIHADLKTDNVVVKNLKTMECKIIDLGACIRMDELPSRHNDNQILQNHYFRAPEVIIRGPFDEKIDIFCVGLILGHLSNKTYLFKESTSRKQLMKMVECLGLPPMEFIKRSLMGRFFFDVRQNSVSLKNFPGPENVSPKSKRLQELFENHNDPKFIDFLQRCLDMDPAKRGSAVYLLTHQWLEVSKPSYLWPSSVMSETMSTLLN